MQATRSSCGPFVGVASYFLNSAYYTKERAAECIEFNAEGLRFAINSKDIHTVVLAASLSLYLYDFKLTPEGETVASAVARTASALQAAGKAVVLIGSPPRSRDSISGPALTAKRAERSRWTALLIALSPAHVPNLWDAKRSRCYQK
jgi:hypothetical protein